MAEYEIEKYYYLLKHGKDVDYSDCEKIINGSFSSVQLASLSVLLARKNRNDAEQKVLEWLLSKCITLGILLSLKYQSVQFNTKSNTPEWLIDLFIQTKSDGDIGLHILEKLIKEYVSNRLAPEIMAAWLMIVCMEGLGARDVDLLTILMRDSGEIYDYRTAPQFRGFLLVRRYPTGALSEKTALVLPSLISAISEKYKIITPFLVAKSLSFTGGTWDKLNSIPDFRFPDHGSEAIEKLEQCGVAMTVTHDDLNPADRMMYQLRSVTGTVESEELIVASIASKQLAVPIHRLLMDIRYGSGSFFPDYDEAKSFSLKLEQTINDGGVPTFSHFSNTYQPGGVAIGNALEVAESICVLGGVEHHLWDMRWINEQRTFVIDFFSKLMSSVIHDKPIRFWAQLAYKYLVDGTALKFFKKILLAHSVKSEFIDRLFNNPFNALNINYSPRVLYAESSGILNGFDQRGIGNFVNITLGGGGNLYSGEFSPANGIVIAKRIGDPVNKNDPLCYIFCPDTPNPHDIEKLHTYFFIEN
jgi:thymidine phosphorylase